MIGREPGARTKRSQTITSTRLQATPSAARFPRDEHYKGVILGFMLRARAHDTGLDPSGSHAYRIRGGLVQRCRCRRTKNGAHGPVRNDGARPKPRRRGVRHRRRWRREQGAPDKSPQPSKRPSGSPNAVLHRSWLSPRLVVWLTLVCLVDAPEVWNGPAGFNEYRGQSVFFSQYFSWYLSEARLEAPKATRGGTGGATDSRGRRTAG
jgi:hypothetical protein